MINITACQIDSRPCSLNPCLNNAICVDYSNNMNYNMSALIDTNSSSFYCLCNEFYIGTNCETKLDVCQNETCSNNGNCYESENMPKCKCFSMYSGDKCESESNELKAIKTISSISTIIAIISIISFYVFISFMDLLKYLCRYKNIVPHKNKKRQKKKNKKRRIKKN